MPGTRVPCLCRGSSSRLPAKQTRCSADPFDQSQKPKRPPPKARGPSERALNAASLLAEFDRKHFQACRSGSQPEAPPEEEQHELWEAVQRVSEESTSVMLGICAGRQQDGVEALKAWVGRLNLPRGLLHGADVAGKPINLPGGVFIKYTSNTGDAQLTGYPGGQVGVLFTPTLSDGEFRQYGYFPLFLPLLEEGSSGETSPS